jgi:uracil-DNA glycosylase family 4
MFGNVFSIKFHLNEMIITGDCSITSPATWHRKYYIHINSCLCSTEHQHDYKNSQYSKFAKYQAIMLLIPRTRVNGIMTHTQTIKWLKEMGVTDIVSDSSTNRLKETTSAPSIRTIATENINIDSSRSLADQAKTLDELESIVRNFNGCDLKKAAFSTVFADGSQSAKVMLIGEAPGANEDKEGIPFCGQSGKLLNNILPSIGLKREDVYITNTVFWRPPGNRRPTPQEIEICKPFVEKHVALLDPELIVLVGSTAVESLLDSKIPMHTLRDGHYDYNNPYLKKAIKTVVIFHPSYLLRQPAKKKLMWYDMIRIKGLLTA